MDHPSNDDLVAFAAGRAGEAAAALEAHLDTCAECRRVLAAAASASAAPPPRPPEVGETIGRYRVSGVLGAGAVGLVVEAQDPALQRAVALKLVRVEGQLDRVLDEARLLARLTHPNVVSVFDVGEWSGFVFLAMELVRGGTLRPWLQAGHPVAERVALLLQIGEALSAAHRTGIVHRDVKPENVLVGEDGRARLADFGVSRLAPVPGAPRTSRAGTPAYMAPELFGDVAPDAASDQFSFCVLCFEVLTGKRPYDGTAEAARSTPAQLAEALRARDVPPAVVASVVRGLSRAAGDRWPSMDALLAGWRPRHRSRRWTVAATLGVCVGLGLAAWAGRAPVERAWRCSRLDSPVGSGVPTLPTVLAHLERAKALRWPTQAGDLARLASRWDEAFLAASQKVCASAPSADPWVDGAALGCLEAAQAARGGWARSALADGASVEELVTAGVKLPRPGECSDVTLLLSRRAAGLVGPGANAALRDRLAYAQGLHDQLKERELVPLVPKLVAEARASGAPGLLARALGLECMVQTHEDRVAAFPVCAEAYRLYERAGLDEEAAEVASFAVMAAAATPGESPQLWHDLAKAKLERMGNPPARQAELRNRWGSALWEVGRLEEAHAEFSEALKLRESIYGEAHPLTASIAANRAIALGELGRFAEAQQILAKYLAIQDALLPPGDPQRLRVLAPLGYMLHALEDWQALLPVVEEILALREAELGQDAQAYAAHAWRAFALQAQGKAEAAKASLSQSLALAQGRHEATDPRMGAPWMYAGEFALRGGAPRDAVVELEKARALIPVTDEVEATTRISAGGLLALALVEVGEDARAKQVALEVLGDPRSRPLRLVRARAEWALARLAAKAGDRAQAATRGEEAERLARDTKVLHGQITAWRAAQHATPP